MARTAALFLLAGWGTASAAPSAAPTPQLDGVWLTPVGESVYACEGTDRAWAVRSGRRVVELISTTEQRPISAWTFDRAIYDVSPSVDCRTAWLRFRRAPRLAMVREGSSDAATWEPAADQSPPEHEVHAPIVLGGGETAWVCWGKHEHVSLLRRAGASITASPVKLEGACRDFHSWERAESGDAVWLIPLGTGLCVARADGTVAQYPDLAAVDVSAVASRAGGGIAVVLPYGKGVYVVDAAGTVLGGGRQLPDLDVQSVQGTRQGRALWLVTDSKHLFRAEIVDGVASGTVRDLTPIGYPPTTDPSMFGTLLTRNDDAAWLVFDADHPALWYRYSHVTWDPAARAASIGAPRPTPLGIRRFTVGRDRAEAWYQSGTNAIVHLRVVDGVARETTFEAPWLPVDQIVATSDHRVWLRGTPTSYLAGLASAGATAELMVRRGAAVRSFAGGPLDADLDVIDGARITWPDVDRGAESDAAIEVAVTSADGAVVRRAQWAAGARETAISLADFRDRGPVRIEATVRASGRYDTLRARWTSVPVSESPWRRVAPWLIAGAALVVPIGCFALLLERRSRLRRWLPIGIPLFEVGILTIAKADLDIVLWLYTAGLCIVLAVVLGLVAPAAFRALGGLLPFSWINAALLSFTAIRRRVLTEHADDVAARIGRARATVADLTRVSARSRRDAPTGLVETYISLPARVESFQDGACTWHDERHPAPWIVDAVRGQVERRPRQVFVEAHGGHGKSALMREVAEQLVVAWRADPARPLPIVLPEVPTTDVMAAARECLAARGFDPLAIAKLFAADSFVIMADGFQDPSGNVLCSFLERHGNESSIVVATRPRADRRRRWLQAAPHACLVEPKRLTAQTLPGFVASLMPHADASELADFARVAETLCAESDGSFTPLLVKLLAWTWKDHGVDSVAAIYTRACHLLATQASSGASPELLVLHAEELAHRHYWKHGQRVFLGEADGETKDLEACGILRSASRAGHVRFFHDSIGSFLAARAALRKREPSPCLEAAGNPLYGAGSVELLRMVLVQSADVAGQASEAARVAGLVRMLVHEMRAWDPHLFSPNQLSSARADLAAVRGGERPSTSEATATDVAVLLAETVDDAARRDEQDATFFHSERLYVSLAPRVWRATATASPDAPAGRERLSPLVSAAAAVI